MTKERSWYFKMVGGLLTLITILWLILQWCVFQGEYTQHDLEQQCSHLYSDLRHATQLTQQIEKEKLILKEAHKHGFFQPFNPRRFSQKIKNLAQKCAIYEIHLDFSQPRTADKKMLIYPLTIVLRAEFDQDIFHFISKLEKETGRAIGIREVHLFRTNQRDEIMKHVNAELKIDAVGISE